MQPARPVRDHRRWMRSRPRLLLAAAISVLVSTASACTDASGASFHATAYDPPTPAPGFTLTSHSGTTVSLTDFAGQPVFLFFGFTHCPDVCPLTLALLTGILRDAGEAAGDASVLLVTVDPQRDTPEVLSRYVAAYGSRVIGLTGDRAQLDSLYQAYGVHAAASHDGSGAMMHTSAVFGIDSRGRQRVLLRPEAPREEFEADVRTLLGL